MASKNRSRYYTPSRTYEFEVKIGDLDYTPDLYKLNIITSIDIPYQTFILEFFFDPNDIILEQIYGQTPIKLTSRLFGEDPLLPQEEIVFDLMYLSSDHSIQMLVQNPEELQKDRVPISITAVARNSFTTMNTLVNSVYQGQKLENAIADIVGRTKATLRYDANGRNKDVIDQILVPPSTLYQCLRYLNRTFGIFNGVPAIYSLYDNQLYIKNLTSKIKASHKFTIWQLAIDSDNSKIIEKSDDGVTFYTTKDVYTSYKGNSAFAVLAPSMVHIVKPSDRFAHIIDIDLEDFSKNYGVISKSNKIFFDKTTLTDSRVSIHKDHTGYELSQTFINANTSKKIANITDISISVEQSMKLLNLMQVGEAVLFNSKIEPVRDLTGKYILRSSELSFQKAKDWESSAGLQLTRTNRTIT